MDEIQVVEGIAPTKTIASQMVEQANQAVVGNMENAEAATNMLSYIKKQLDTLEEQRKKLTKPLNDHVKFINGEYKKVTSVLSEAQTIMKKKLGDFLEAEEKRQQEEAERAQKEAEEAAIARAEELQAAGDNETAEAVLDTVADTAPKAPEKTKVKGSMMGKSASTRKTWTYEIVDQKKVPKEFLMVNNTAVKDAIKQGTRDIPGLRIYQESSVTIR